MRVVSTILWEESDLGKYSAMSIRSLKRATCFAKRVEWRCCAFYHTPVKPALQQIRLLQAAKVVVESRKKVYCLQQNLLMLRVLPPQGKLVLMSWLPCMTSLPRNFYPVRSQYSRKLYQPDFLQELRSKLHNFVACCFSPWEWLRTNWKLYHIMVACILETIKTC